MQFVTVKTAYHRWNTLTVLEGLSVLTSTVGLLVGSLSVTLAGALAVGVVDHYRRIYRALFWNQALALHSSKVDSEPEIYRFMSRRHRSEHARRSFDKFKMQS